MKDIIKVNTKELISLDLLSSSKGNQSKFYDSKNDLYVKLPFNYQNVLWKDYLVEIISSMIINPSHLLGVEVVEQSLGITEDNIYCCVSKNFCKQGEQWISIKRIIEQECIYITSNMFPKVIFNTIIDTIKDVCKIDLTDYLIVMVLLDYLLLNEDRHLNNIGVIRKIDGSYRLSPLFDFGLGLFEHDKKYSNAKFKEAFDNVIQKPFNIHPINVLNMLIGLGYSEKINYILEGFNTNIDLNLFPNNLAREFYLINSNAIRRL